MNVNDSEVSDANASDEKQNINENPIKEEFQEPLEMADNDNERLFHELDISSKTSPTELSPKQNTSESNVDVELKSKIIDNNCSLNKLDNSLDCVEQCLEKNLIDGVDVNEDLQAKVDSEIISKEEVKSLFNEKTGDSLRVTNRKIEEQLMESVQFFYPEIEISKTPTDIIQEGLACILKQSKNVFYNPVQEFNRDLSVAAISVFADEHQNDPRCHSKGTKRKTVEKDSADNSDGETVERRVAGVKYEDGIVVLEALSATGLRSIRYAKEVPGVKEIVANDIASAAVESIKRNIEYNKVDNLVLTSHNDASLLMYMRKAQDNFFDVVDLDPYGCPSRFLDAAVQCVRDGGLLLITCTDMAVLAGNSPETCYVKYGAVSLRSPACHEMALRITLQCIESHANRYGRYIVPQLSFSADFYIRVIVKVYTSPAMCKRTTSKLSMIYQCGGCQTFNYWPLGTSENSNNSLKFHLSRGPPVSQNCVHCGSTYYQGGPIWSAPLHNSTFVEKMLFKIGDQEFNTEKRMEGMLELIREELKTTLLYYTIDSLCSKVHCEVIPRNKFVSALLHAGYSVTLSHAAPNSVKTNAPSVVIWDIVRCWVKEHPVNPRRLSQGSVAEKILNTNPQLQANFELHPEVMPRNRKRLLRYQQNPQPFWGPGMRDKTNCYTEDKMSKSHVNQNKKHKRAKVEKEKAQMKAKINSTNIDIIEVVTITDDEDDENDLMERLQDGVDSSCSDMEINSSTKDEIKDYEVNDKDFNIENEANNSDNIALNNESNINVSAGSILLDVDNCKYVNNEPSVSNSTNNETATSNTVTSDYSSVDVSSTNKCESDNDESFIDSTTDSNLGT